MLKRGQGVRNYPIRVLKNTQSRKKVPNIGNRMVGCVKNYPKAEKFPTNYELPKLGLNVKTK